METTSANNLNNEQKQQLLDILDELGITHDVIVDKESFTCYVALQDDKVVDVRIFDPFHTYTNFYTDATGWTHWLAGVCE